MLTALFACACTASSDISKEQFKTTNEAGSDPSPAVSSVTLIPTSTPTPTPGLLGDTEKTEPGEAESETDGSEAGYEAGGFEEDDQPLQPGPVVISEILSSNTSMYSHRDSYYDMIELCNTSAEPVSLGGLYLSDSKKKLEKGELPDVSLAPGEYIVFYCTGEYEQQDEYDLPFELSYFGETVYLSDEDGKLYDVLTFPELPCGISYGRSASGSAVEYYDAITMGEPNHEGFAQMTGKPEVSVAPGSYAEPVEVSFTVQGDIYYTLDGTKPDRSSCKWDGEDITIDSTCTLRAVVCEEGKLTGFDASFSYLIGEPDYELDVLCLSIASADFDAMIESPTSRRKYPVSMTLLTATGQAFEIDAAITPFGNTSRYYDKKSYRINFNTEYGPSKLKYKLFDDLDIDSFNSLVIRSCSQDNEGTLLRDEFTSSLLVQDGICDEVLVQAYRPVNLYINGEYRGLYYIREHIDEDMVADRYDCDPEQVTILEQGTEVKCGSEGAEWKELWKYVQEHDLSDPECYEHIKKLVCLESVADYYILQMWCENIDPDNVRTYKITGGKWRYILYDLDLTFSKNNKGMVSGILGEYNPGLYTFNALAYKLLKNSEFMELFCERMETLLGSVLSDEYAIGYLDEFAGRISHDAEYNCERWSGVNDSSGDVYYVSYSQWQKNIESLRKKLSGKASALVNEFIKEKYVSDELVGRFFGKYINAES